MTIFFIILLLYNKIRGELFVYTMNSIAPTKLSFSLRISKEAPKTWRCLPVRRSVIPLVIVEEPTSPCLELTEKAPKICNCRDKFYALIQIPAKWAWQDSNPEPVDGKCDDYTIRLLGHCLLLYNNTLIIFNVFNFQTFFIKFSEHMILLMWHKQIR